MERSANTKRKAFTLIELLIVVAIIAIMAAIAVPNFLEAQTRAKVSRAKNEMRVIHTAVMAYVVDWNQLLRDYNDYDAAPDLAGLTFSMETGKSPDVIMYVSDGFYTFRAFRPLTTPIAYITSVPTDPFSKIMPFGMDTRGIGGGTEPFSIVYSVVSSGGPDRIAGHWMRGNPDSGPLGIALPYDATNGTKSLGDIWRVMTVGDDMTLYHREYGDFGNW